MKLAALSNFTSFTALAMQLSSRVISLECDWYWCQQQEGMVEFIGMLKVKVIKGTNLAIRDIKSSDPYVVLSLGQQVGVTIYLGILLLCIFYL